MATCMGLEDHIHKVMEIGVYRHICDGFCKKLQKVKF